MAADARDAHGSADAPSRGYAWLDSLDDYDAHRALLRCCGSQRWADAMLDRRPFGSAAALRAAAREVWAGLDRDDYLEAFASHPPIGGGAEDHAALASTRAWSAEEQSGAAGAAADVARALRDANRVYRQRFGFLFIVCATGKSADQMLAALQVRLTNEPEIELLIAAAEQGKITELRLEKVGP
ncbi:MAG TPA: 2-oxo-4-hydroxy-4-carboxy-5-ureidoimidazoline decarboxylase [Polyangiaceae bacterium]|jgi:2-oxo-4-hydroxy-4-carboxy-5-ureidoimidazoline decarboxylase|nr:2-oxo-4-hydroxy-4-carboxy-5-ureidoimidazoline decarboxylase [Polyangiaceae bacterium]